MIAQMTITVTGDGSPAVLTTWTREDSGVLDARARVITIRELGQITAWVNAVVDREGRP